MTTHLETAKALVAELQQGSMHVLADRLAESLAQHESEHRALVADNAALVRAVTEVRPSPVTPREGRTATADHYDAGFSDGWVKRGAVLRSVIDAPHPGASLLSELHDLRTRVEMMGRASWYADFQQEQAKRLAAERERDEARAQVATALTGPLAWMTSEASDWADGEVGVGHKFRGKAHEAIAMLEAATSGVGPNTICALCGQRRAEHLRRHHGTGPKGTVWYCRGPVERPFEPATTPPPSVVPVAKVREAVTNACDEQDADLRGPEWIRDTILLALGINLDGEL